MNKFITLSLLFLLHSSSSLLHGMQAQDIVPSEAEMQRLHFEIFCREDTFFRYDKNHVLAYVQNPANDINEKFPEEWIVNGRKVGEFPQPCLHRACMKLDAAEIVKVLLSRSDVKINEHNDCGATPLSYACVNSSPDIVSLLLEKGADVNTVTEDGRTPVFLACCHGRASIVELLIAHKDIEINKGRGEKPIFLAARMRLPILDVLFNSGKVDIHTKNDKNQTAFYIAWFYHSLTGWVGLREIEWCLTIIQQAGAQRKKFLEDELHALVHVNVPLGESDKVREFIEFCVDRGADLNQRNEQGDRPVDVATRNHEMGKKTVLRHVIGGLQIKKMMMDCLYDYTPTISGTDFYDLFAREQ